jgi:hypothetical protein
MPGDDADLIADAGSRRPAPRRVTGGRPAVT